MEGRNIAKSIFCKNVSLWISFLIVSTVIFSVSGMSLPKTSCSGANTCLLCLEELKDPLNTFEFSCKHRAHMSCCFGALLQKCPGLAVYRAETSGLGSFHCLCSKCGNKEAIDASRVIGGCELWWLKQGLESRFNNLFALPFFVFRKTVDEDKEKAAAFFCELNTSLQRSFLKRFFPDECIPFFKALCKKKGSVIQEQGNLLEAVLKISDCLRPADRFVLLPEEKQLDYFATLSSEDQIDVLWLVCRRKLSSWQSCLKMLCKRTDRSALADKSLKEFVRVVFSKYLLLEPLAVAMEGFVDVKEVCDKTLCTEIFSLCESKAPIDLSKLDKEIVRKYMGLLWNTIDDEVRKRWTSHSYSFLNYFWDKYLPEEQVALCKKIFDQRGNLDGARKVLKRFSKPQSCEFIAHVLMGISDWSDLELITSWNEMTPFQKSLYLTGVWKVRELSKEKNFFIKRAPELGQQDQISFMESVLKSKATLVHKAGILSLLSDFWDSKVRFDFADKLLLLFSAARVNERISVCKKLWRHMDLFEKVIEARIAGGLIGEKIELLAVYSNQGRKGEWLSLFKQAFDSSSSSEKCMLVESFLKSLSKEEVLGLYRDRIKTECDSEDIQKYKDVLSLL